jgi:hypothetical protein
MKKLMSFGVILALLWGITKFWPSRKEPEGRVEVRVNARRPKTGRRGARRPAAEKTRPSVHQQPHRTPRPEEVPVEV